MLRRSLISLIVLLTVQCVNCQVRDSIWLPLFEKKIRAAEKEAGTFLVEFDSLEYQLNQGKSLAELFQNSGAMNIRVNSPGNLSTLSFRGLSGVHTRVLWNGLNLNSPSSGVSDLSAINQSLFSSVSVRSDAHPSSAIELGNNIQWQDKSLEFAIGRSSFNGSNYALTYNVSNGDFFSRTHFDYRKTDNDFPFRAENFVGSILRSRENSENRLWNFQQDFGKVQQGRNAKNTHSGHLWVSNYNRNLPGSILFPSPEAKQIDKSVRLAYKWLLEQNDLQWTTTIGYLRDRLEYSDAFPDWLTGELIPFASDYTQRRIHLNSNFNFKLESYNFLGGMELRTINVESSNYGVIKPESAIAFSGKVQRNWERARLNLALKQEFSSVFKVPFNASLGYDHYFTNSRVWASIKRVGRAPIFDDFFFIPGGNPELGPEQGWAFETGFEYHPTTNSKVSVNLYRNSMNGWIQWVPIDTMFTFSPVNYTSVNINGLRLDYQGEYPNGDISFVGKASLTLQKSQNFHPLFSDSRESFELLMNPNLIFNTMLGIREGKSTFGYRNRYVGQQYIDEFNSSTIPSFIVHDLFFTAFIANRIRLSLQANNLANRTYFTTNSYPMYGRNFSIQLIYRTIGSEEKKEVIKHKTRGPKRRGAW